MLDRHRQGDRRPPAAGGADRLRDGAERGVDRGPPGARGSHHAPRRHGRGVHAERGRARREEAGAVGVLVNNAGYSQSGAIETVPMADLRRQFETNVFGLVRMCQLVLPGMRERRWGRIVNLSSMGGRLTFPGAGVYHGTKHAVEAISDALRFEVAGFGVKVVVVEPGLIRTEFAETASRSVRPADGPYGAFNAGVAETTRDVYSRGPFARLGGDPEDVAAAIERVILRR